MGTRQTLDVLNTYAALLRHVGDAVGSDGVSALANALSGVDDKKFKPTVSKVAKLWALQPEAGKSSARLSEHLNALQKLLSVGGAKASVEIGLLAGLVAGYEEVESSLFERALREAVTAAPVKAPRANDKVKVPKAPKAPKREPLSAAEVRAWADRFTAVSADRNAFEAELSALQEIPKLSSAELAAVAERYLGHGVPKSKPKILSVMRSRQKQDAIEASREGRISHIAV